MEKNIIGLIIVFLYIGLLILAATIFKKYRLLGEEESRKFIHIGVSNCWIILMIFFDNIWIACIPMLLFTIVNYASYRFNIIKSMERRDGDSKGTIYYPIAFLILVIITFWLGRPYLGAIGALILGYGDGLAGLIGQKFGRTRLFGKKTIVGMITMFIVSLIIALIVLSIFTPNIALPGSILIALAAAAIELFTPLDIDNLTVPIGTTLIYYLLLIAGSTIVNGLFVAVIINIVAAWLAYYKHALTFSGIVAAFIIGTLIYFFAGPLVWLLLIVFLVSSSLMTHFHKKHKINLSADYKKSCRNYRQVLAKGITVAICSILYFLSKSDLFFVIAVASIAASCADTWGSEIGPLSKGRTISITTLKPVKKGSPGGISLLGTSMSLAGALFIAILFGIGTIFMPNFPKTNLITMCLIITFAGLFGSLVDSLLGAVSHHKLISNNELINLISNLVGTILGLVLFMICIR